MERKNNIYYSYSVSFKIWWTALWTPASHPSWNPHICQGSVLGRMHFTTSSFGSWHMACLAIILYSKTNSSSELRL